MTSRVEATRRHGPFDLRWPKRRLRVTSDWQAAAEVGLEDIPDGLDWDAFSARYVPAGRRRHNLDEISAYGAYQHLLMEAERHGESQRVVALPGAAPASLSRPGAPR